MGAEKHYAGRWICQKPADRCDGTFSFWGERRPCPLAGRCRKAEDFRGQLEYCWPQGRFGKLLIQSEPDWDKRHMERYRAAKWAFCRDAMNAYARQYAEEHREELRQNQRRCTPTLGKLIPGYVPRNAAKPEEPPCGGDCRNCPYETCWYEDWEGPRAKRRRIAAPSTRAYQERRKERIRTDPEYAERERAKARAYVAKYRAKVRAIKKQREGT